MASASPVAQSISPSANSAARDSNCLASLGCGVNVSGYAVSEAKIRSRVLRSTPVAIGGSTPTGLGGRAALCGAGAWARVSSRAACIFDWKSASAPSASSTVMSPRLTSDSTYSLRTLRCSAIARYISGWV